MKLRYLLLILAVPLVWAAWVRMTLPENVSASTPEVESQPVVTTPADAGKTEEQAVYQQQTRAYQEQLAAQQAALERRQKANASRENERSLLSLSHEGAWRALVFSNWATFQELRQRAAHNGTGHEHCTICNGRGQMSFCILCNHSDGKCLTCRGTGKLANGDLCPTCVGTGKCFLCGGSGKMPCPFCDDGTIYLNGPLPPNQLPFH